MYAFNLIVDMSSIELLLTSTLLWVLVFAIPAIIGMTVEFFELFEFWEEEEEEDWVQMLDPGWGEEDPHQWILSMIFRQEEEEEEEEDEGPHKWIMSLIRPATEARPQRLNRPKPRTIPTIVEANFHYI